MYQETYNRICTARDKIELEMHTYGQADEETTRELRAALFQCANEHLDEFRQAGSRGDALISRTVSGINGIMQLAQPFLPDLEETVRNHIRLESERRGWLSGPKDMVVAGLRGIPSRAGMGSNGRLAEGTQTTDHDQRFETVSGPVGMKEAPKAPSLEAIGNAGTLPIRETKPKNEEEPPEQFGGLSEPSSSTLELTHDEQVTQTEERRALQTEGLYLTITSGNRTVRFKVPLVDGQAAQLAPFLFRNKGQNWELAFEGESISVRNTKGVAYIAELLRNPGREVFVAELFAAASGMTTVPIGSSGEVIDETAARAYRERAEDLRDQLAEAEKNNDSGRRESVTAELEELADQVLAARGLSGRRRQGQDDRDRIRKSVSMAIERAIKAIRKHSPTLAEHLHQHLERGYFPSYSGDISWEF